MPVRFFVAGDVHGRQNLMYDKVLEFEKNNNKCIDVVLQAGDFETIKEEKDFEHYYAPVKYHHISDISDYCKGLKNTPKLTIFTGGNHEAWGVLRKYGEGGFICPQVYYLGLHGTLNVKGIKIGGLTGVFDQEKYKTPLSQIPCYDWKYYRKNSVEALKDENIDILLLHEWPALNEDYEIITEDNVPENLKRRNATPANFLINEIKPKFVFAGHLHNSYAEAVNKKTGSRFIGLKCITEKEGSVYICEMSADYLI